MKKRYVLPVIAAVLVLSAGGCNLLQGTYDIEIDNNSSVAADIYYRESGTTEWELLTAVAAGYATYESLPAGTYDFRAVWTNLAEGSDPEDPDWILGTETDCVLDFQFDMEGDGQTYDYNLFVSDSGLSFI